jgi:peptidoglycan/xylan/chitin deacetylase (PgdA/CDA1 family)/folate-dependent phosphoribosylglycinamide formyltransferase PurN
MARIAVFTSRLDYSVQRGIAAVLAALPDAQALVLVHAPRRRVDTLLRNQFRNLRRHGWRWIPHQTGDALARLRERLSRSRPGGTDRHGTPCGPGMAQTPDVTVVQVEDINDEAVVRRVQEFQADLGISLAAPILRNPLFAAPRLGTLNLHKGKVPEYRGMPPAFWELYNGEKKVGCTIHQVDSGLDTGGIVLETEVPIAPYSTVRGLQLLLDQIGIELMREAAIQALSGTARVQSQRSGGRTYRKPTLGQEAALSRRLGRINEAQTPHGLPVRLARELTFRFYAGPFQALPRTLRMIRRRQRVVVLLYHRVNDDMRDNLTVGIEQFAEQMALLARSYPLVTIDDVVAGRVPRDSRRPAVAVTFDDGYLDNFKIAVPILLRYRVPAAFFVSTGKISSGEPFEHDMARLGRGPPAMDWQQLREMRDLGFTIGSHTVSHLNCAKAPAEQVQRELRESKRELEQRLGLTRVIFAYPFGGRNDINQVALEMVRAEGYTGCLSAYGGCNDGSIDSFNVRRTGIHHQFSMASLRAYLEGWTRPA